jgi:mono/diheme cytochrome c family protein
MNRYWLAAVMIFPFTAISLAERPLASVEQSPAGTEDGRALFSMYCASCHGASGHGNGPVADALVVRPPDLSLIAARNGGVFVAARIERTVDGRDLMVAHGTLEMPVWGDAFRRREGLSEADIRARIQAIVRYLASIQQRTG